MVSSKNVKLQLQNRD